MPIYAIGDVQGCFRSLERLVADIGFDPVRDRLWFVGDLVNRGPQSLDVLRYINSLGSAASVVLGNHDVFLLAVAAGVAALRPKDTLQDVLKADDAGDLLAWLRRQPFHHREGPYFMVHAGLLPQWTIADAEALARGAADALSGPDSPAFLQSLFHEAPHWSASLTGLSRLAAAARIMTKLRTCTPDGSAATGFSGPPDQAPPGHFPWFQISHRRNADAIIICGHWAALGLHLTANVLALDSGCIWGRHLTAVRLEDRRVFQVACGNPRECRGGT